jgi:adenylate cyclase
MALLRRLAAILAADVAGYSRLMGRDEEGTHRRFTAHRRELFEPRISQHHGRIVKSTGDGMIAEFPSVVEAVLCAVEVQCEMSRRNRDVADNECIAFRIGINVGDVIAEPDDIFGDGVNIAARLEGLAEPNGICISELVYDQIKNKLNFPFEDFGQQWVKNIERPLHTFVLPPRVIADLPFVEPVPAPKTAPERAAQLVAPLDSSPPRLSIVVLPFANLSERSDEQYLADAITDDVTTDLSRIADMVVISRNTAFTYKDKPVSTRQIGRELNVRYVLEGSVRRVGSRIRVNSQLIDAETDSHVWSDRLDHASDDLFRVQDEVTSRIAVALNLQLIGAEASRPTSNPDALDYLLRGRAAFYHPDGVTTDRFVEAVDCFERALALDPSSVDAQAMLAIALIGGVFEQMADRAEADMARAEQLVQQALATSPSHPLAHFARGQILRAQKHYAAAIREYEAAIATNRNWVVAIASLGFCKYFAGAIEEAIPAQELAIRLSPRDSRLANWYWRIGMVHLLQSRVDEAILWMEKARTTNVQLSGPHAWLAAAFALKGDILHSQAELGEARRLSHDNRYDSIALYRSSLGSSENDSAEPTFLAGLRLAGVPEE